jgi:hypothetical protein
VITDVIHDHMSEELELTQVQQISILEASHSQITDSLTLTQVQTLIITEAWHGFLQMI